MNNIDLTLDERGKRYGNFDDHAAITQALKVVMQATPNWGVLADDQKESLEMVAHKIGRILNGDPNYADSWHDIAGYIRLVEQRLDREEKKAKTEGPERAESYRRGACVRSGDVDVYIIHIDDELTGP